MTPDSQLSEGVLTDPTLRRSPYGPDSFMHRCLELAKLGAGLVAPNPMVGAVLVYEGIIIGEGYHQKYGEAHAEVNCLNSVKEEDRGYISKSTLYVSLEPCNFFGKTPPCTDLILKNKIPKVVIGCLDPNNKVDGKGIEKLRTEGIEVVYGILERECVELNKRFFTFQKQHRPFIILKWAETADGKMAHSFPIVLGTTEGREPHSQNRNKEKTIPDRKNQIIGNSSDDSSPFGGSRMEARLLISNEKTNRLVHKWRSEEASILVGTNTALMDDPQLTNRHWEGPSPIRLVLDMDLRLPETLKVFDQKQKTIIFNSMKQEEKGNLLYFKIEKNKNLVQQLVQSLFELNIQSVLVEGGARLLQSFINENIWDEIRIIKNEKLIINNGLASPQLPALLLTEETRVGNDLVNTYIRS